MFYRARYYDPRTGRFISEDQIGFYDSDANIYRYVKNKVLAYRDPYGLATEALTVGLTAKQAGAAAILGLGVFCVSSFVVDSVAETTGQNFTDSFCSGIKIPIGNILPMAKGGEKNVRDSRVVALVGLWRHRDPCDIIREMFESRILTNMEYSTQRKAYGCKARGR